MSTESICLTSCRCVWLYGSDLKSEASFLKFTACKRQRGRAFLAWTLYFIKESFRFEFSLHPVFVCPITSGLKETRLYCAEITWKPAQTFNQVFKWNATFVKGAQGGSPDSRTRPHSSSLLIERLACSSACTDLWDVFRADCMSRGRSDGCVLKVFSVFWDKQWLFKTVLKTYVISSDLFFLWNHDSPWWTFIIQLWPAHPSFRRGSPWCHMNKNKPMQTPRLAAEEEALSFKCMHKKKGGYSCQIYDRASSFFSSSGWQNLALALLQRRHCRCQDFHWPSCRRVRLPGPTSNKLQRQMVRNCVSLSAETHDLQLC